MINPFGPDDGYAYTPLELEAIWSLEVTVEDVVKSYEIPFAFHRHASVLRNNPFAKDDQLAVNIITHAACAEVSNLAPPEPPSWPCQEHPE